MNNSKLIFCGHILDNVHGFIPYTVAEQKIMETLLFKRLQSIKQLSIANWVFPGSEHTRFIHSLGVMHIADKMAISLNLGHDKRRLVRLAGLLHDIGHYPLSHVCESQYKKPSNLIDGKDDEFCVTINEDTQNKIDKLTIGSRTDFMTKSSGLHHEAVGANIVTCNKKIRKIIIDECNDENAPNIIADIITGNIEREETDPLLVQIIHSELDADGIDYLMRDAKFSGTSFGAFELEQLISCLQIGKYIRMGKETQILCVKPKGIAAADQYLINKFFSYSQVVFNRHIMVSEWMTEQVVNWMQKHHAIFPDTETLEKWTTDENSGEDDDGNGSFLSFTDNMFWAALERILTNEFNDLVPHYIKEFCKHILHHNELDRTEEVRIISNDSDEIKRALGKIQIKPGENFRTDQVALLSMREMSKQIPLESFNEILKKQRSGEESMDPEELEQARLSRLMECVSVVDADDETEVHLLCDDCRSLMKTLYNQTLVILRTYAFPTHGASVLEESIEAPE